MQPLRNNVSKNQPPLSAMKKITLLVLCFTLSAHAICQVKSLSDISPTTEEEYNYATLGYPETVAKGLDIKSGYKVDPMGTFGDPNSSVFEFKLLVRDKEDQLAGVIVKAKSKYWGKTYHVCIPINNSDLTQRYNKALLDWDAQLVIDYARVTSAQMANLMAAFAGAGN